VLDGMEKCEHFLTDLFKTASTGDLGPRVTYRYSLDPTTVGTVSFSKDTYSFLQNGLSELRELLLEWNQSEKIPPYEDEVKDLARMIEWGRQRFQESSFADEIVVPGVSVGHLRYLKAGAVLQVLREEMVLEQMRVNLPSGVIATRLVHIGEMKRRSNVGVLAQLDPADVLWEVAPYPRVRTAAPTVQGSTRGYEWDVFLSHATEDKQTFVDALAAALIEKGLRVWYDGFELRLGDHLRRSIERGLARSRFGIVVLSPRFFAKDWPQRELDGMAALEVDGRKVILPIWHDLGAKEVRARSPMLADRVAISSGKGVEAIVAAILQAMMNSS
jgi:hypothetical protein